MRVHDYLEYWAAAAPGRPCVEDRGQVWTYADVDERARRFARVLQSLGVGDGDRFAVVAKNRAEWAVVYYGAFRAGAVPVPLNFRQHPREWVHQLDDSSARVVIAEEEWAAGIEDIAAELAIRPAPITFDAARPGWSRLDDLLGAASPGPLCDEIAPTHDLYQMYTSGTTGRPKGAVLTHAAVAANVEQIRTAIPLLPAEDTLVVMPLFHAGAAVTMFLAVACGASMHLMRDFDPAACARRLDEGGIAVTTLVPAMIQAMLVHVPDVHDRTYARLRAIAYGASPIAEETLRSALEAFGCEFHQAYGQTEASAGLTMLAPDAHRRALEGEARLLASCGRPLVGTRIQVVDEGGDPVPAGTVGEICARGPQVMRGYWNLPEATAATLAGGWLHTGDAGFLDEEGYLYIADRVKDMIVSGGENIYPREIEDVIYRMPAVAEAAVIGVPDDRWGEAVRAVVVAKPGETLTGEGVVAFCRERLAGYKCPAAVDLVGRLPRNATGKVLKTVLREPHWEGVSRRVG